VKEAKIVILVFSSAANNSRQVRNEIVAAADANVIIFPFRIENVSPSGGMQLHLSRVHWLDAMTPPMESHIDRLVASAKRVLDPGGETPGMASNSSGTPAPSRRGMPGISISRGWAVVGLVFGSMLLLGVVVLVMPRFGNWFVALPVIRPFTKPVPPSPAGLIFPDSDKRELTPQDLAVLTCFQLDIARNEIYARHGRYFNRADLKSYFSHFNWYKPYTFDPPINVIEQINVQIILHAEREKGCPHL
jgi:hypothetical protein